MMPLHFTYSFDEVPLFREGDRVAFLVSGDAEIVITDGDGGWDFGDITIDDIIQTRMTYLGLGRNPWHKMVADALDRERDEWIQERVFAELSEAGTPVRSTADEHHRTLADTGVRARLVAAE